MNKKFSRIFVIVFMAFAVCAFVSFEDARQSDDSFSRGEMLQQGQPQLLIQPNARQIKAHMRVSHTQTQAFTDGGTTASALLSLTNCILRC